MYYLHAESQFSFYLQFIAFPLYNYQAQEKAVRPRSSPCFPMCISFSLLQSITSISSEYSVNTRSWEGSTDQDFDPIDDLSVCCIFTCYFLTPQ